MSPSARVSRYDFEQALGPALPQMRILHYALAAGPLALLAVIVVLALAPRSAPAVPSPLEALSVVTAVVGVFACFAGPGLARSLRRTAHFAGVAPERKPSMLLCSSSANRLRASSARINKPPPRILSGAFRHERGAGPRRVDRCAYPRRPR